MVGRRSSVRGGRDPGLEAIVRPMDDCVAQVPANQEITARLDHLFATRTLLTTFQPICHLETGEAVGAEALTRFVKSPETPRANGSSRPIQSAVAPNSNFLHWKRLCWLQRISLPTSTLPSISPPQHALTRG